MALQLYTKCKTQINKNLQMLPKKSKKEEVKEKLHQ